MLTWKGRSHVGAINTRVPPDRVQSTPEAAVYTARNQSLWSARTKLPQQIDAAE